MRSQLLAVILFMLLCFNAVRAQQGAVNRNAFRISAIRTKEAVFVDGQLDEAIWKKTEKSTPFYRILPIDTGYAQSQTEVRIAFDESKLYLGIICFDTLPGKRPAESLRRDFSFGKNDNLPLLTPTMTRPTVLHSGYPPPGRNGMDCRPTVAWFLSTGIANGGQP
jgi:hypothetical protein